MPIDDASCLKNITSCAHEHAAMYSLSAEDSATTGGHSSSGQNILTQDVCQLD